MTGSTGETTGEIVGIGPFGRPAPRVAVAVARAGGLGVLDLGTDRQVALAALAEVGRWWRGPFGVRVPAGCGVRPDELPAAVRAVVLAGTVLRSDAAAAYAAGRRALLEVTDLGEVAAALRLLDGDGPPGGLIARDSLLPRLLAGSRLARPVYAAGDLDPAGAARAVADGAAGIVLDLQLALARETGLPADVAAALAGNPAASPAVRHKTAGGVVRAFRAAIDARVHGGAAPARPAPLDIAVVGVGCAFPGAPDAARHWAHVVAGTRPRPSAAPGGDPARLALDVAGRALADAGYADRPFDRARTAVIVGADGGIAAWLASRLGLGGTAYTVDAACASPLAALDAACKELAAGTSDTVLCGGAASFDGARGGPFAAACLVLKRRADAERDGDRVHALVASVGTGADPLPAAGLVEAHGVDPDALAAVHAAAPPGTATLGAVTSRIGHTRCAAGLAGLVKAAHALHTGILPATPHAVPGGGPFATGDAARPWPAEPGARVAAVSGAGFGGTVFHAVLTGYDGAPDPVSGLDAWPAELFLVRGADRDAALARLAALARRDGVRLRDLARTCAAWTGPVRAALVATGRADLLAKIDAVRAARPAPGVFPATPAPGAVAFLHPGHDGAPARPPADLFLAFPRLRRLLRLAGPDGVAALFPASGPPRRRDAPALVGLAVHRLLTELGVRPDLAAGHGAGELVALCAAGVIAESDLVPLGAARAAALRDAACAADGDPGGMAAVAAAPGTVRAALAGIPDVVVAQHNAPRQVVVSGPTAALDRAVAALAARGLPVERLAVDCALHGPSVAGAAAPLRRALAGRDLRSPAFPVWSGATAAPHPAEPGALAAALAGQAAAPVRFVELVEAMYAAGARVFVETGPGDALTGLVGEILGDRPHRAVACDVAGEPGLPRLLLALAELAAAGVPVDASALFAGRDAVVLPDVRPAEPVRHVVRTRDLPPLPVPEPAPGRFAGRRFVVADDGGGVALALADLLERQGARVTTPPDAGGPCDGLIHLGALRPGAAPVLPGAYAGIRAALAGGPRWVLLASGGEAGAGLQGLARTLAREYPRVRVRSVEVDAKERAPAALAALLLAELLDAEGPVAVVHSGAARLAPEAVPAALPAPRGGLGLDGRSVVLLTGGARGVPARVARALAATGCRLELAGRAPQPPPEDPALAAARDEAALRRVLARRTSGDVDRAVRRVLAEREMRSTLRDLGASVRYHQADVRDAAAVRALVADVRRRHGRLDGVVHAAGLAPDRLVRDMSPRLFDRVYRTRVDGARALAAAVPRGLRFFAVLGGAGRADHAAAHDACAALVPLWREALGCRVLAADWGPGDADAAVRVLLHELAHGDEPRVVLAPAP
ncbi:type I polyketide synthase [Actinomadura rayongensis]|uniref:SDR family NAD(P)-dependent oxidoreductase n=1 Tax=Actinomadura rayongensis TaxID=1429076 RepID=A0A6I4WA05_9ACTN|nr:type I polyketide synthase [Actinomadura rayongensis]MXQ66458.1 SDR family NAD(P)-dependent oxidoreductase [Actinomadura rayongensis]